LLAVTTVIITTFILTTLCKTMICHYSEFHYAESHYYAECGGAARWALSHFSLLLYTKILLRQFCHSVIDPIHLKRIFLAETFGSKLHVI
jgi:hypothetical protein